MGLGAPLLEDALFVEAEPEDGVEEREVMFCMEEREEARAGESEVAVLRIEPPSSPSVEEASGVWWPVPGREVGVLFGTSAGEFVPPALTTREREVLFAALPVRDSVCLRE